MEGRSEAIVSLVLGVLSVVLVLFLGAWEYIPLACGVVGIIFGVRARQDWPGGMATAGFVLSIIGTSFSALILIAFLVCIGTIAGVASELPDVLESIADDIAYFG